MTEAIVISRYLDTVSDEIYDKLSQIVQQIESFDLKKSQLNNLTAAANASTEARAVAKFIKHQTSREGREFEGWKVDVGDRYLHEILLDFCEKQAPFSADKIAEEVLTDPIFSALTDKQRKDRKREIGCKVMQRFVGNFTVLYSYEQMRRKAG